VQEGQHKLLKLRAYKARVIHALQLGESASSIHNCFLWSAAKGEIDPQLALLSDKAWFNLQGYINTHNNNNNNTNSFALAHELTIPTERPPIVGEVSANFCG
jgi:hypothetical protein